MHRGWWDREEKEGGRAAPDARAYEHEPRLPLLRSLQDNVRHAGTPVPTASWVTAKKWPKGTHKTRVPERACGSGLHLSCMRTWVLRKIHQLPRVKKVPWSLFVILSLCSVISRCMPDRDGGGESCHVERECSANTVDGTVGRARVTTFRAVEEESFRLGRDA